MLNMFQLDKHYNLVHGPIPTIPHLENVCFHSENLTSFIIVKFIEPSFAANKIIQKIIL